MLSLIICILLLAVPQSETQVSPPEHKTALMGITEKILQNTVSFKKYLKNDKAYQKYIRKLISKDSKPISPPKLKSIVTESVFMAGDYSMQLFQIGEESSKVVLYLPGGGYVEKAMSPHWRFADKIALGSGRTVFLASYPTAPVHTYIETFILLDALYRDLLTKYGADNIILVGDSAGGGLAAALCQDFAKKGLPQPYKTILLSPWVDATMTNSSISEIEKVDPMLPKNAFMAAIAWAGEDYSAILEKVPDNSKLWEWQISPLRGDVSVMKNVRIFVGTHEIFYPDILLFDKKLRDSGVDVFTYVAPEMVHEFPLFPLKEVKWSVDEIIRILSEP